MISAELTIGKFTKVILHSGTIVTGKMKDLIVVESRRAESYDELYQIVLDDRDIEWTIDGSKIEAVAQW